MSNITEIVNELNKATNVIVFALSLINFCLGTIGLLLNLYVFTRSTLRHEPCSIYFFSSTCFNLFVIFIVLPVRLLSSGYNIDLADYNNVICRIEFFSFYVVRVISCWLIVCACIDRYLHSSSNIRLRQLSSKRIARLTILFIIILFILLYSHMIIYFEITNTIDSFDNIIQTCNSRKGFYRIFLQIFHISWYSLCPSFFMLLFGYLTLKNIRQRRQIRPLGNRLNQKNRRKENQVLYMLAAQVFVTIISTSPICIYRIYRNLTVFIQKDTIQEAKENLANQTLNIFSHFAHSSSFYLYTATGAIFRKEIIKLIIRR